MKKFIVSFSMVFLTMFALAQGKSHHSSGSRPVYSGDTHTSSHGGSFPGSTNSETHKGGHYVSPTSQRQYGVHKKK